MRVEHYLRQSASRFPAKTVLVAGPVRLTYADIDAKTDRLAAALQELGVARNDRVLVFMDNCAEMVLAIFAILKAGATFVPVNGATKADKLARIVADCRPTAIIGQKRLATITAQALGDDDGIPVLITDTPDFYSAIADDVRPAPAEGADGDLAMLIYTSGSTGEPKGVMMAHRNVDAAATAIATYLDNTSDDVILSALPLAFNYGLYQLLTAFKVGATLVLEKNFAYPAATLEIMRREKVTGFPLVPTMAAILLQRNALSAAALPHLRYITNAAAPLPAPHIARLRADLPNVAFYSMYGQTECVRGTWLPPAELDRRLDSVGIAIPGTRAVVVDEEGRPLPAGIVGELAITGPHVMLGYWDNPIATARVLRPGRSPDERTLLTGDLFRADADGFLYFVGRKDDIIKTRGEKVAPKEVEAVLFAIPGIIEAVVVGVPDPVLGQAIKAIVVKSDPSLSEGEIIRACARGLEDFMVPRSVEFRDSLPKTETGKVSRRLAVQSLEVVA